MSIFEAGMMVCFGAGWPVALSKTYRSKSAGGKSLGFSYLVLTGYVCGILHKILYNMDWVIWLYLINVAFVVMDMILCYKYRKRNLEPAK